MIIVLDAGHGGNDPGAVGNGMKEADLTLDICKRVQGRLGRKYLAVVRLAPRGEPLERAIFANNCNADLFLSIHVNAGGGTGFESYIYPGAKERTRKLRDIIHNAIIALPIKDRGKKEKNLCVLRETVMPAVLLECLFIDNEKDAALLIDEVFRDKLANEVAWGIAQALELEEIGHAPCANCQQVNELMMEVDRLRSENTKYRQAISAIRNFMAGLNY